MIARPLLFKKVTIIPREQITKVSGTAYNRPIDNVDVTNLLSFPDGNIIVKIGILWSYFI